MKTTTQTTTKNLKGVWRNRAVLFLSKITKRIIEKKALVTEIRQAQR
ncbi:hypothetical protein KKC45_04125 [Patescibacteria group bacterium]|nr:hypothetical protein [Patescibacteria group bacterium]